MNILIAIPVEADYDETETPNEEDSWEMLMRDLRDDVERVADLPAWNDANPKRETIYNVDAWVYRFEVDDELGQQLLSSAYASCPDLVIERADA